MHLLFAVRTVRSLSKSQLFVPFCKLVNGLKLVVYTDYPVSKQVRSGHTFQRLPSGTA